MSEAPESIETSPVVTPDVAESVQNQGVEVVQTEAPTEAQVVKTKSKKKRTKDPALYHTRKARIQVDPDSVNTDDRPPQTGTVYNIWFNKWSGGDKEDEKFNQKKADGRCSIARDSGYTRADKVPGSYFCLYFARGLCTQGHKCEFLHRLPVLTDMFSPTTDCFGRDRFFDYRDDMGGIGSISRVNRTLYVGRIHVSDAAKAGALDEIVSRHFSEWGDVDRIRVLHDKGVAFVTYATEVNAQFAKEAMAHQSLDSGEVLNVRWATQDPDPLAQAREQRRLEENAAEAIKRLLPQEYVDELEGRAKKSKPLLEGYEEDDSEKLKRIMNNQKEAGAEPAEEVKQIEPAPEPAAPVSTDTGLFNKSSLSALKALKKKKKTKAKVEE
ncbi:YALIA101S03e03202g1_1 [Yarrowia lipolytica]|nr:Pre-mRNA-splicing factor CWC2 [Yarrowia lipolytica]SEI32808.1 YALIA101S03e03202g1_1 [Yarrowia lipolytica]